MIVELHGQVRLVDVFDPDGNRIQFTEEIAVIRPAGAQDLPFLRDMLRHAYYARWGTEADVPLERYVAGWGRPGDEALVAIDEFQPVGAAWYRLFEQDEPGYGFVDEETPELTIAIVPEPARPGPRRAAPLGAPRAGARRAATARSASASSPTTPRSTCTSSTVSPRSASAAGAWVMQRLWPFRSRSRSYTLCRCDGLCIACGSENERRPEVLRRMRQRALAPPARRAELRTRRE